MSLPVRKSVLRCLGRILQPIARFSLRYGVTVQQFLECAKLAFVAAARIELERGGEKFNISRISLLTGLRRREVARLLDVPSEDQVETKGAALTRIIGRWLSDSDFREASGKPRVLTAVGERSEFYKLVRKVSRDVSPGTVLGELLRNGSAELTTKGLLLKAEMFVPAADQDEGIEFLGLDVRDLLESVQENLLESAKTPNHHSTTEYDNIPADQVESIRSWLLEQGATFHRTIRDHLASIDRDLTGSGAPGDDSQAYRVAVGSFSRIELSRSASKGKK